MLEILISVGSFITGLVALIYGADILVKGGSSFARKAGFSTLFIGLTVVSFGTSMPELIVNIFASFRGSNDIAIGNIIGSNISNILLILGISSIIYPLVVSKTTVSREIPFGLMAGIVLFILANDAFFPGGENSLLHQGDGLILIAFFILFMYYTFGISKVSGQKDDVNVKTYPYYMASLMVVGGIIALAVGGNLLVEGAVTVARVFGMSEALIGLTIVAVGTSLPELATSAVAAYRKEADIAIGNIVGSNIFNIFWILGVSSIIKPLTFSTLLNIDLGLMILATVILFIMIYIGKKNVLERWQGGILFGIYAAYIVYLVMRG